MIGLVSTLIGIAMLFALIFMGLYHTYTVDPGTRTFSSFFTASARVFVGGIVLILVGAFTAADALTILFLATGIGLALTSGALTLFRAVYAFPSKNPVVTAVRFFRYINNRYFPLRFVYASYRHDGKLLQSLRKLALRDEGFGGILPAKNVSVILHDYEIVNDDGMLITMYFSGTYKALSERILTASTLFFGTYLQYATPCLVIYGTLTLTRHLGRCYIVGVDYRLEEKYVYKEERDRMEQKLPYL